MKNINRLLTTLIILVLMSAFSSSEANAKGLYLESIAPANKAFSKMQFINDQQGVWYCYKYLKDDAHSIEHYDEDYAKEFSKHAYFILKNDTLSGQGIYNTEIYAYKYPVKFTRYDDESVFITALSPQKDSLVFIRPYNLYEYYWENNTELPYYHEAPLNTTMMYLDGEFVVYNRGYFFFFKKEDHIKEPDKGYGVPGDDRNYFRVELFYQKKTVEEAFTSFAAEYPYGKKQLLIRNENRELLLNHRWEKDSVLKLEKSQANGKFVLTIEKCADGIKMTYYGTDDYEGIGDEYEG